MRKNHNKLYYGKYRHKTVFKLPGSLMFYPTTDEAIEFLMKKGFDAKLGARPLQRVIDDEIKKPLSKMMLFGELTAGGMVEVSLADEKLVVNFKVGKQQEVLTQLKPKVSDEKKSQ